MFDLNGNSYRDITRLARKALKQGKGQLAADYAQAICIEADKAGELNGSTQADVLAALMLEIKPQPHRTIERTADFLQRPDPPWLFEKLLPKGELAFIYGPSSSYKSFVALSLAGAVTTGQAFAGRANLADPGASLYLVAEGQTGVKKRIAALAQCGRFNVDLSYIDRSGVQLHVKRERDNFVAQLLDLPHKPRVITIDTFARHGLGLDENSSKDASAWVGAVETVADKVEATALVVHHSGKDADRGMRGSSALFGAASTVIRAERSDQVVTLLCDKQRDFDEFEPVHFKLRNLTEEFAVLEFDHHGYYLTEDEQIIMDCATRKVPKPFETFEIVRPNNTKIPRSTLFKLIRGLVAKGLLYKVCHGQYAAKVS